VGLRAGLDVLEGKKKIFFVLRVEIRIVLSVACHFNDNAIRKQQQQPS